MAKPREFSIGDKVMIPWADPTGYVTGEVMGDCGTDFYGKDLYTVKPEGSTYSHVFSENEMTRIQKQKIYMSENRCQCGLKFSREGGRHSDYCPEYRKDE